MNFKIRSASTRDIQAWATLRQKLWPSTIEKHITDISTSFNDKEFLCFVVEDENKNLIGFLEACIRKYANGCEHQPVLFAEGIWVDQSHRRNKIANTLIEKLEVWGKANGYKEICSDCGIENHISIQAHNAWGFKETERVVYFRKKI
ncbi:MAG: hypothetical protein A2504_10010 [Bdellovibrionales bacterium RIFOXYD12_FULL_39_22]|nr:MAG: hypothetical protein A2385_17645 [Bdellovibrionales bacterium RIFOXYB1_FULL_39_21]OFZ43944.1 MAG: hypothetical protein A2485_04315 [Bdellovibrionales bacterium RIFOXYC12_FULL_39_17]OFZ48316.1 MAG: hypothetical protein A2404_01730 [Bdellovibrionales bacterium RIFOXYC1_FULL_39_130]OFZ94907.1 MAG: hypothetical protein A2504_10010 [Bdellovibrionales bacterium RIFOXYD12_FULL_39_22]HLE12671.1 aminoglycoside 6'-N-acetyltransferase [Bacteriovoracaceae bacterium]